MHEMSLVTYVLNAVENKASGMGIEKVGEIGLVIGRLAAVPELMERCFQIARYQRPMFQEATLHIEMRDIRLRCRACGTEYSSQDAFGYATCPECGSGASDLLGGKELLLDYFVPAKEQNTGNV